MERSEPVSTQLCITWVFLFVLTVTIHDWGFKHNLYYIALHMCYCLGSRFFVGNGHPTCNRESWKMGIRTPTDLGHDRLLTQGTQLSFCIWSNYTVFSISSTWWNMEYPQMSHGKRHAVPWNAILRAWNSTWLFQSWNLEVVQQTHRTWSGKQSMWRFHPCSSWPANSQQPPEKTCRSQCWCLIFVSICVNNH